MLLVRGSVSKARAILKDTLHGIKSLFSTGYQRLPKAPPFVSAFSCGGDEKHLRRSFRDLDNFYDDAFSSQRQYYGDNIISTTTAIEEKKNKTKKRRKKKKKYLRTTEENTGLVVGGGGGGDRLSDEDDVYGGSFMGFAKIRPSEERQPREMEHEKGSRRGVFNKEAEAEEEGEGREESSFSENYLRVELCCTVAEALKKLEQLDASNVEHVLDIEEVRHYYSRIKSPFYLDIFNNFFIETYTDFLPPQTSQTTCRLCHRR